MQGEAQQIHPPQVAQEVLAVSVGVQVVEVGDLGDPVAALAHRQ